MFHYIVLSLCRNLEQDYNMPEPTKIIVKEISKDFKAIRYCLIIFMIAQSTLAITYIIYLINILIKKP